MKRLLSQIVTGALIAGLIIPTPLFLDTHHLLRRKDTTTIVSGLAARTQSTGKITNNGCDGATLACQCAAMGSSAALGACNAGTTIAEDAATGMYEITVNALDLDNEKCIITAVCSAGINDIVLDIDTAIYASYLDITSQTATQPAVKLTGNTTGAGLQSSGGSNGSGIYALG